MTDQAPAQTPAPPLAPLQREHEHLWVNALSTVRPSDAFLREVGEAIVGMVRASMSPSRQRGPLDPVGDVLVRVVAS